MDERDKVGEPMDLIAQAKGRAAFLRNRGEVKTPDILDAVAARLADMAGSLIRRNDEAVQKIAEERTRAEAAEAALARLQAEQDAMVEAIKGAQIAMKAARGVIVSKREHALLTGALVGCAEALSGIALASPASEGRAAG